MKTYLVTGAAGFIGSNFIKYLLHKKYVNEDIKVIILDALTYAGNLGTIKDDIDNKRCFFVKGDIRDRQLVDKLFAENDIDYVVNFAAESHVDRSIEDPQLFLSVNILGTQNLMDAARKAWVTGKDERVTPLGKPASAIIRFLPTRSMVHSVQRVTSRRPHRSVLTAPTLQVRPAPTSSCRLTAIHTTCRSLSPAAPITMVLITSPRS